MNPILPAPDALPLPGPVWLFVSLLHLTFVAHLLAMNFLLGGTLLAVIDRLRARTGSGRDAEVARWFERKLPAVMAFTVSLGVAPLLFLQTVYGHLFYSSSVLMAWPWFSVIGILMVTYSLVYYLSFKGDALGRAPRIAAVLALFGLLSIAFLYVNNMTLAIRPEAWAGHYFARPGGTSLNADDATFWPRLLHFITAAPAVAGLILATAGARRIRHGDEATGRPWLKLGALWFIVPTLLQFIWGMWWLIGLEREIMLTFMGGDTPMTLAMVLGILLPLAAVAMTVKSMAAPRPFGWVHGASWLLVGTIVCMVLIRHAVREYTLAPVFDPATLTISPQWDVFGIFAILLVIALAVTAWMIVALVKAPNQTSP